MDRSVRIWATLALIGIGAFALYYPTIFVIRGIEANLQGDLSWRYWRGVDFYTPVPFFYRLGNILKYLPAVLFTEAMLIFAMLALWRIRGGRYFEHGTIIAVQWCGVCAALAAFTGLSGYAIEAWYVTAYNPTGRAPVHFVWDSGEIGVFLAGLGVALIAWVLRLIAGLDRDNQEYV